MCFDLLLITVVAVLMSSCNTKGNNRTPEDGVDLTDSSVQDKENVAVDTLGRVVISPDQFIALLRNPESEELALACGLSLVYKDEIDGQGDADTEIIVYGVDVEKGDKQEFGYAVNCLTDHACYFEYQADTSQQASIAFKGEEEAKAFVSALVDYGIIICGSSYFISKERLPETVSVDSLADYNVICELSMLTVENGLYVMNVSYYM